MPYNGSGTFTPATGPGYPAVSGTTIEAAQFNNVVVDIATGLSTALPRDGQGAATADIPMGTFKLTGVGNAAARTQYLSAGQAQDGVVAYLSSVAGTDTITATAALSMSAYAAGQVFNFIPANTNTGAVTINLNSIGAKSITKNGTTALVAGDLTANMLAQIVYDGTRFQLYNPNITLDATLTALASALTAANKIPYATATDTLGELTFSTSTSLGTSDTTVSSQNAVKSYADTALALKANLASPTFTGTPAAPTAAASTNTTQIATTAFVQQELAANPTLTEGTERATTSGSSVEWTGIPAGTKRITISLAGVGAGSGLLSVVIGDSGGYETTGYVPTAAAYTSNTSSLGTTYGSIVLTLEDSTNNTWVCTGTFYSSNQGLAFLMGAKSLSGTLTQVKLSINVASFDGGAANILYE